MSKPVYRGFGVGLETSGFRHAIFDMSNLPEEFQRTFGRIEPAAKTPFVGVTTDGHPAPNLYELKETGLSTAAIAEAARDFLASLRPEQQPAAALPLDCYQRRLWCNAFMPYTPHGVLLQEASDTVRQRALALVGATLSAKGFHDVRTAMKLNAFLGHLINDGGRNLTEWMYWLTIFGTPSEGEPWGWQVAGHHLDLNVFVLGGQIVITPAFIGAEPRISEAIDEPYAGLRVFDEEQARGLELIRALSPGQQNKAIIYPSMRSADLPPHLAGQLNGRHRAGAGEDNLVQPYEGIAASELTSGQRELLLRLMATYVGRLPHGHDALKMAEIERHLDQTHFSWIGGTELERSPFFYRVHSPVVMIEFDHHAGVFLDNAEPERFHAHTIVRTPNGNDYGIDLLRQHYERFEHTAHGHVPRHGAPRHGAPRHGR